MGLLLLLDVCVFVAEAGNEGVADREGVASVVGESDPDLVTLDVVVTDAVNTSVKDTE